MNTASRTSLLTPFARDQRADFAAASGDALLRSQVETLLATDVGELPWRTNFGSRLARLRQRPNDDVLRELARLEVRDALRRWLPDAEVTRFEMGAEESELLLDVRVRGVATEVRRGGFGG